MPSKHYTNQNNHVFTRNKLEYLQTLQNVGALWAPKLKTLQKIKNIYFSFENQDLDITIYKKTVEITCAK